MQFAVIHLTLFLKHFLFNGTQKTGGPLIQQGSFGFFSFWSGNFHDRTIE